MPWRGPCGGRKPLLSREEAVAALSGPDSLLLLGGAALSAEMLEIAGRIAAKTGCKLLSEWANARQERGAGRVVVNRVPYPIDQALETLAPFKRIVLLGARAPIGFFAYPNKPAILTAEGTQITNLCTTAQDIAGALEALCRGVGAADTPPAHVAEAATPDKPSGPLEPGGIAQALARTIPEDAIVIDEAITTGRAFFPATAGAPKHTWVNNCGGSIGYGMPVAIGAAVACPDRKVMALIGDGSAMYTVQALWTQARENLNVTTVIFNNRSYAVLHGELRNVGAVPGPTAHDIFDLDRPDLDWVAMAGGMGVEAVRVDTAEQFNTALAACLHSSGPMLIEAMV